MRRRRILGLCQRPDRRASGRVVSAWGTAALLFSFCAAAQVGDSGRQAGERPPELSAEWLYRKEVRAPLETLYRGLYEELERSRLYVVAELNIGKNLARNAERWGEDYNRNRFEGVRSMVLCNPWYANQVLNRAPDMMALCPMSITLLYKEGVSVVLFERLLPAAAGSPVEDLFWQVENTIVAAIETAAAAAEDAP